MRRPLAPSLVISAALGLVLLLSAVAAADAADGPAWTPDQLGSLLAASGYADLANLRRNGGVYTADATRYGARLQGIRIDAQTGEVLVAPSLTPAQVPALLAAKGYTAVSGVRAVTDSEGASISARATDRSGHADTWTIDPWSGAVYPATDTD